MEPIVPVAVHTAEGSWAAGLTRCRCGDVSPGWWLLRKPRHARALLSFSSQYLAFFEFNNRLEAILSKAYIYR